MSGVILKEKKQPWKAFESSFRRYGNRPITYDAPKGAKLEIAGTSGELSLDILYDTGDCKASAPNSKAGESDEISTTLVGKPEERSYTHLAF